MDYASEAIDPRAYNASPADVRRCDLSSIRGQLEECTKRLNDLAAGTHSLADSIVGSRPENAANGLAGAPVSQSIASLVNELQSAVGRIETNLSRL